MENWQNCQAQRIVTNCIKSWWRPGTDKVLRSPVHLTLVISWKIRKSIPSISLQRIQNRDGQSAEQDLGLLVDTKPAMYTCVEDQWPPGLH